MFDRWANHDKTKMWCTKRRTPRVDSSRDQLDASYQPDAAHELPSMLELLAPTLRQCAWCLMVADRWAATVAARSQDQIRPRTHLPHVQSDARVAEHRTAAQGLSRSVKRPPEVDWRRLRCSRKSRVHGAVGRSNFCVRTVPEMRAARFCFRHACCVAIQTPAQSVPRKPKSAGTFSESAISRAGRAGDRTGRYRRRRTLKTLDWSM